MSLQVFWNACFQSLISNCISSAVSPELQSRSHSCGVSVLQLANMLLLLWLIPLCVFVRSRCRVFCRSGVGGSEMSVCMSRGVSSSTDPVRLHECLLRSPSSVPSAASVTLHGLSMASGETRVVLDRLPVSQKRVSAGSGLLSSVVLLDRATHMVLVLAPLASEAVDPSFSLSLLVSVHKTQAMPLEDPFVSCPLRQK